MTTKTCDDLNSSIKSKIQRYINLGIQKSDIASMIQGWALEDKESLAHEFLIGASPGKDIDQPTPVDPDEDSPVLPEDAWVGLFAKYRELVGGTTEASDNYHYADFLVALGCTLGHRVNVHYAGPIYPNFYVCNIGRTGESRKTTAANRAKRLCNKLNSNEDDEYKAYQTLNQIGSIEHLYDSLNGKKRVRLIYYPELGSLMAKAQQSGSANVITDLTNLWDTPERVNPSTRRYDVNCELPFVSILACSTLEWLYKYMSLENIYSGFANRWNFIYGEPKPPMPDPPPVDEKKELELLQEINDVRKWAAERPGDGTIGKSAEAEDLWREYYTEFFNDMVNKTGLLPELMIRIPVFIWKIALLYACQDKCGIIRRSDLLRAIRVGQFLERSMRTVFRGFSSTENRKKEDRLIDYLKKVGAKDYRSIYRGLNMSADELMKLAIPLKKAGIIYELQISKGKMGLSLV